MGCRPTSHTSAEASWRTQPGDDNPRHTQFAGHLTLAEAAGYRFDDRKLAGRFEDGAVDA